MISLCALTEPWVATTLTIFSYPLKKVSVIKSISFSSAIKISLAIIYNPDVGSIKTYYISPQFGLEVWKLIDATTTGALCSFMLYLKNEGIYEFESWT